MPNNLKFNKKCLFLWDTAGQEDYEKLRPMSYPESNVVLICYSIDNPDSLENASEIWAKEIEHDSICDRFRAVKFKIFTLKTSVVFKRI